MNLQSAIFNWLQIKVVADARPDDQAALDTTAFFEEILVEDHGLRELQITRPDADTVQVHYKDQEGRPGMNKYDAELVEQLLEDIESNPKYN